MRAFRTVALVGLMVSAAAARGGDAPVGSPGALVDPVTCAADPDQSYALYLPRAYTTDRLWPVLYLLDPRGRGALAAEIYRDAAEELGWILASSNDTASDGPARPNYVAAQAMLDDTFLRLAVDPERIYSAGMSGTARAACDIAAGLEGRMPGVIHVGAGCSGQSSRSGNRSFDLVGIVGTTDFNYHSVATFDDELERSGVEHLLISFDGPHGWHPPAAASEALAWLELRAMARGLREPDPRLIDRRYAHELRRAAAAEEAGDALLAHRIYRDAAAHFAALREVTTAGEKAETLGASKEVKRAARERRKMLSLERERLVHVDLTIRTLERRARPGATFAQLKRALGLDRVMERAAEAATEPERLMNRRLLETIFVETFFYVPRRLREAGDAEGEAISLRIAALVKPDRPDVRYDLACAQARAGQIDPALDSLEAAIRLGFGRVESIANDPDLASLRETERFAALAARARKTRPQTQR